MSLDRPRSLREFSSIPTPAWAVLFFSTWVTGLLAITSRDALPPRFSYDGLLILHIAQGQTPFAVDRSFQNTAMAYRLLGLQNSDELTVLFGLAIMVVTLTIAITLGARRSFNVGHLYLALAFLVLGSVFLTWYSKDVFTLGIVIVTLVVVKFDHRRWWLVVLAMVCYAALFRTYWFLVAAGAAGLVLLARRDGDSARRYLIRLFLLSQAFLAVFCVVYPLVSGNSANTFRSGINASREGALDAVTIITPLLSGDSPLSAYLNAALTQLTLLVPWPLLTKGPQYVLYALGIVGLWVTMFSGVVRHWTRLGQRDRMRIHIGISVLWALLTVQAIFEPDYGSYLRHLTPAIPLFLAVSLLTSRAGRDSLNQSRELGPIESDPSPGRLRAR